MKLNESAISNIKTAIENGNYNVEDGWSFTQEDANALLTYLENDYTKFAKHFLALSEEADAETLEHYAFPAFKLSTGEDAKPIVYLSALQDIQDLASTADLPDIAEAALDLIGILEKKAKIDDEDPDKEKDGTKDSKPSGDSLESVSDPGGDSLPLDGGGGGSNPGKPPVYDPTFNAMPEGEQTTRAILATQARAKDIDWKERTLNIKFSSEYPVKRNNYFEILDHSDNANIDLSRFNTGKAPLLLEHDPEKVIGVVESATVNRNNRSGNAVVRFSRSEQASEVLQDINDGIRNCISFSYVSDHNAIERSDTIEDLDAYRFNKWTGLEISVVSIPADPTASISPIARGLNINTKVDTVPNVRVNEENIKMSDNDKTLDAGKYDEGVKEERARVNTISDFGKLSNSEDEARKFIANGNSVEEFRNYLNEKAERTNTPVSKPADLGLTEKETKRYSIANAIDAVIAGKRCFELEVSDEVAKRTGQSPQGFLLPEDIMKRTAIKTGTDLTGEAGEAVGVDVGEYIPALTDKSIALQLCSVHPNLTSDFKIPVVTTGPTTYIIAEDGTITEDAAYAATNINLHPWQMGSWVPVSRNAMKQSATFERMLVNTLMTQMGNGLDAAVFAGSGSNEPLGIQTGGSTPIITSGIVTTAAAPTYAELAGMIGNFITGTDSASTAYVMHPSIYATALSVTRGGTGSDIMAVADNKTIAGYPVHYTSQLKQVGGTGTILAGDFSKCHIGLWGAVEIQIDPYTQGNQSNVVVRAFQEFDSGFVGGAFHQLYGMTI